MSKIRIGSPARVRKRTLSSYASFALFVAAAAIALSAVILRIGKDRLTETDQEALSPGSGQTVSTTVSQRQTDGTAQTASSTTAQTSKSKPKPTEPTVKKTVEEDFDEWEDSEQTAAIQVMANDRSYVRPSGGAVIKPCSIRKLAYSRTMNDWRVHNGLDIAAEKGEIVKSAAEGKVTDILHDSLYGTTIVVNQNDGRRDASSHRGKERRQIPRPGAGAGNQITHPSQGPLSGDNPPDGLFLFFPRIFNNLHYHIE